MRIFEKDFVSVPILVCLTHADRLYEEKCEEDMIPTCPEDKLPKLKSQFEVELEVKVFMKWQQYYFSSMHT